MPRRFYVAHPLDVASLTLAGAEAHHLLHVLRLGISDEVILFDGQGSEASARITAVSDSGTAELQLLEHRPAQSETPFPITLGVAVPKGDRFAWLVEKATELGVTRLVPLVTDRSVVEPGEGKLERMQKTIVEASKQSGRGRLMELGPLTKWSEFVDEFENGDAYIADPGGDLCDFSAHHVTRPVILAVGPEGGFTDAELDLACEAGAQLISLGPRTLRIETAALALATLFSLSGAARQE
jgi:16S rRNA (uracil1498-N3)-methyltransferase